MTSILKELNPQQRSFETALTIKLRIYPTTEQVAKFEATQTVFLKACNVVSQYVFDNGFLLKQVQLHAALYRQLRQQFDMPSMLAESAIRTVIAKYKTVDTLMKQKPYRMFDQLTGHRVVLKRDVTWLHNAIEFKTPFVQLVRRYNYSFKNVGSQISIGTLNGRETVNAHWNVPYQQQYFDASKYEFGGAQLLKRSGKWYLYQSVKYTPTLLSRDNVKNVVGIDRGLNFLATSYDSHGETKFVSGRQIMAKRHKFAKVRKQLQQKGTSSARRRLKQIGSRENRWMTDVNHQVTKALVEQFGKQTLFVLEDLTGINDFVTENMAKKARNDHVSWAFFQFETDLKYKARLAGSEVLNVPAQYTSQRCPKCGQIRKANRNHERHEYRCAGCGYTSNDDRIGAMNIQLLGTQFVSGQATPKFSSTETINVSI